MRRLLAIVGLAACALSAGAGAKAASGTRAVIEPAQAPASTAPRTTRQNAHQAIATGEAVKNVTQYTLPPELYRKARRLGQISFWGTIVATLYSWLILVLVLNWRLGPMYRDWAERASGVRFVQAAIFAPLLLVTIALLTIPLDVAQHWIGRYYGLSLQGWGSWAWDWGKQEIVLLIAGIFIVWILYSVIRRSPRRWWFYFWLISLPLMVFVAFVEPLVIDPMFHKFVPLDKKDPALVSRLEDLVHRAGVKIPPDRMFWMGASAKTTELNAYVTGVGASKRIVVWDTTIRAMDTPQIVFVVGHEMGHYVLDHIWKGMAAGAVGLFILFYLIFRVIDPVIAKWGGRREYSSASAIRDGPVLATETDALPTGGRGATGWEIRSVGDWASLPALLLLVSIFSFIATPIGSAVSRHFEHEADRYGLQVTHGLTANSAQVAAQSFEILGEVDLADPRPNPVDVFLFYSHPPIADRIRFALTYGPWAASSMRSNDGGKPEAMK